MTDRTHYLTELCGRIHDAIKSIDDGNALLYIISLFEILYEAIDSHVGPVDELAIVYLYCTMFGILESLPYQMALYLQSGEFINAFSNVLMKASVDDVQECLDQFMFSIARNYHNLSSQQQNILEHMLAAILHACANPLISIDRIQKSELELPNWIKKHLIAIVHDRGYTYDNRYKYHLPDTNVSVLSRWLKN